MTAEASNLMIAAANNMTMGAIFMIAGGLINIVSVILLILAARTNMKTARLLAEISARR